MRWTFWRRSANTLRGRAAPKRTAKSCGPDAPTLASSSREASFLQVSLGRRWQESPVTGESAKETVKTIARGMPGVSGVTVVTNARAFYTTRAAAGAPSARHSLRPLFSGPMISYELGRIAPRGCGGVSWHRHCERSEASRRASKKDGLLRRKCSVRRRGRHCGFGRR
jgi:hypothetical protein